MEEWLLPAQLYIQNKFREAFDVIESELPEHTVVESPRGDKSSFTVVFPSWKERDEAHAGLGTRRRSLPLRQGACALPYHRQHHLGCPRSRNRRRARRHLLVLARKPLGARRLCAPPFSPAMPNAWASPRAWRHRMQPSWASPGPIPHRYPNLHMHSGSLDWHDWWCSDDAAIYQFIGQDDIYFYCIAQTAIWEALDWNLHQSTVSANYHLLYMGERELFCLADASPAGQQTCSTTIRASGMRAHWLSLGLSEKPVSFSPKAYDTRVRRKRQGRQRDSRMRRTSGVIEPALKEGALLTGVFNRLARSCFYGVAVKEGDEASYRTGCIPAGEPSAEVRAEPLGRPPSPSSSTCTS